MFEQTSCKKVVSLLPDYILGGWTLYLTGKRPKRRHVNLPFEQYQLDTLDGNQ